MIRNKFKLIVSWCIVTILTSYSFSGHSKPFNDISTSREQRNPKPAIGNLKINQLLDLISKKENVHFVYSNRIIEDIIFEDLDISQIQFKNLQKILLTKNLKLTKVSNKQFIIQFIPNKNSSTSNLRLLGNDKFQQMLRGIVVDSLGKNLSGVTVKDLEGNTTVQTNADGKFEIQTTLGHTLLFNSMGYKGKTLIINSWN